MFQDLPTLRFGEQYRILEKGIGGFARGTKAYDG
jgi:hypothetical protein